jgi:hypothetical protein
VKRQTITAQRPISSAGERGSRQLKHRIAWPESTISAVSDPRKDLLPSDRQIAVPYGCSSMRVSKTGKPNHNHYTEFDQDCPFENRILFPRPRRR